MPSALALFRQSGGIGDGQRSRIRASGHGRLGWPTRAHPPLQDAQARTSQGEASGKQGREGCNVSKAGVAALKRVERSTDDLVGMLEDVDEDERQDPNREHGQPDPRAVG